MIIRSAGDTQQKNHKDNHKQKDNHHLLTYCMTNPTQYNYLFILSPCRLSAILISIYPTDSIEEEGEGIRKVGARGREPKGKGEEPHCVFISSGSSPFSFGSLASHLNNHLLKFQNKRKLPKSKNKSPPQTVILTLHSQLSTLHTKL